MMRLVRDYDEDVDSITREAMASEESAGEEMVGSRPKRGKRRGAVDAGAAPGTSADAEMRDGQVEDAPKAEVEAEGAEGEESSSAAIETVVDLPVLEALLLSTHHPLTAGRLAELMDLPGTKPIRQAIKQLNEQYEQSGRSFRIEQVAGGYQILTLPQFGDYLKKLHQKEIDAKLTKAALETLAIVAYKQPILRADVEAIRGVACGETIRSLMEKHLVKIAGRAEEPGRPILYGTTKRFLELFGLNSLKDLPKSETLPPQQA
ncbi:MAG TPA: SMC-Scp complex subunit ScpB [Tepidisphaeraceae bacterium]|nr:SMC-Scp complex subunit ScpB [Tepidisphaeraceae bacterium]